MQKLCRDKPKSNNYIIMATMLPPEMFIDDILSRHGKEE